MSHSDTPFGMTAETMTKPVNDMQRMMAEFAQANPASRMMSPLMAHPTAMAAAVTAMGFGAASHAMGVMLGSMQGAMESSRRMGFPVNALDFGTSFRSFDPNWLGAFGEAVADEAAHTARQAGRKAADVVAEVSDDVAERQKDVAEAVTQTASAVSQAPASAIRQDVREAEPVHATKPKGQARAKAASPATEQPENPVSKTADVAVAPARPNGMEQPQAPDDLKQISGVGPKLEEVLNKLGIWTFGQIASWSEKEIAWVDDYLQFSGRIERDGWVDQAARLAKK